MVRIKIIHEGFFQYTNMVVEEVPARGNFIRSMD